VPNDPRFGELHGLDEIHAPEGWDLAGVGAFPAAGGVKIGVVDSGVRATHEDLAGKVVDCDSFVEGSDCADDNGHGTHVAGTIAATANNGVGIAGVAFNATLSICKALGPDGVGYTSDVASCITDLADKGARVISLSLGGVGITTLQQAVRYAYKDGTGALIVAAAGNEGDSTLDYPAGYDEVVSVAATDPAGQRAAFSNANDDVEVAAPGVDILSTWNTSDSSYETLSGTSMATPHVSGVAALIFGRDPTQTAVQVRAELDAAVDDLGVAGRDPDFGFGRVNLAKAAVEPG
jgi:thermitase